MEIHPVFGRGGPILQGGVFYLVGLAFVHGGCIVLKQG